VNPSLAAVVRIKRMADAAAGMGPRITTEQAAEAAAIYERLRAQARTLTDSAGWSVDEFDAELPELAPLHVPPGHERGYHEHGRGLRALVLLGQLSAWAAGYQEVFELEARLDAEARAQVVEARRRSPGF
jgi:hypothetical protein